MTVKLIQALVQEKTDLLAEYEKMTDLAGKENRTLSEAETKRADEIVARVKTLEPQIEREQFVQSQRKALEKGVVALPGGNGAQPAEDWETLRTETLQLDRARRAGPQPAKESALQQFMRLVGASRISGGDERAAAKPFASFGENLLAAVEFATTHQTSAAYRQYVANIQKMFAATGLNEQVGSEGGLLVQTDFVAGILTPLHEEGPYSRMIRMIPISADANGLVLNAVNETSRATGSRWGGVRGYRVAEAGTLTASKPDFRRMEWRLKKYGVLVYSTDELLRDSAALETVMNEAAGEELSFLVNDDILNGTGVGGALGMLVSPCLVSVPKETGQAAQTVVNANLIKMWQRLHPRYRKNACWCINTEVEPQLDVLTIPAGTAALEPRYVTYGPDGVMRIKGKPVYVTEFNAALGTQGDIFLCDPTAYIGIDKGGVQYATSIHVQFLADEQVFRFIYRFDGQCLLNSPITPYKGSNTQSCCVALDTRA